ncbi:hypothetical protein ACUN0C_18180 [Faunimonas sp. B44]|uniref:hypothetical protein n=1 Tax=Faunimonas sp. B44 TaxID=3461493 RepID=UPI004043B213
MNGVHWAPGGIAFLIQGKWVQTALGLALDSPIELPRTAPDHNINLAAATLTEGLLARFEPLADDPLVKAMAPEHHIGTTHEDPMMAVKETVIATYGDVNGADMFTLVWMIPINGS